MKIATWNVNSVRVRKERLLRFLERERPDALCLQELKVDNEHFPYEELQEAGYHAAAHAQKTYNGVAILSRVEPQRVRRGMPDDPADPQARLITAEVDGVSLMSAYVPNGSRPDSEKFRYKLGWLERLLSWLERDFDPAAPLILTGDLNIAPHDSDVANPGQWKDTVLCVPEVRAAFERLREWGLRDCVRLHHPDGGLYSWWDYRMLGFAKGNGLRIDHILATEPVFARCSAARVDRDERKGKQPSDHAPVIAEFSG